MKNKGYRETELYMPAGYSEGELLEELARELNTKNFEYEILKKSLDARKKKNIRWQIRLGAYSEEFSGEKKAESEKLEIPYRRRKQRVVIAGSGPAGFFSAYILLKAGFGVILLERGPEVDKRYNDINDFEKTGRFREDSNYSFGEGGAGTFSDGKLTSRSKKISAEKKFIFDTFIDAGAPEEIAYLSKPHIGSDNLRIIVPELRKKFLEAGGEIRFGESVIGMKRNKGRIESVLTGQNDYPADYFIFACGHSAYDTYRLLGNNGVGFRTKPFAIGVRAEHEQELINISQWGLPRIEGVKAAEYKLTFKSSRGVSVYSFCMCPGGRIVPAAPAKEQNIVNGVSNYMRDSKYANSGIVAALSPEMLAGRPVNYLEALELVEGIEGQAYRVGSSYAAPYNTIESFIENKITDNIRESSYPFGLIPYDFGRLLPLHVTDALREAFVNFDRKIKNYRKGSMVGIETKTSSPIQALRDKGGKCSGLDNIFIVGEGSGYAGGIVSSAADGIKAAMMIAGE